MSLIDTLTRLSVLQENINKNMSSSSSFEALNKIIANFANKEIENDILRSYGLEDLISILGDDVEDECIETDEEKVIRLLKHDFEENNGISFEKFMDVYHNIVENNPEKLI